MHLLKLLRATPVGIGPKGTIRKRARLALERWNALTDRERVASIPIVRQVAVGFVLTVALVKKWKADLWSESIEAGGRLKSEQDKLALKAEAVGAPQATRSKVPARRGGEGPSAPSAPKRREKRMGRYDRLLLHLLLQELANGNRRILKRPIAQWAEQLPKPPKVVTDAQLRPDRTPVFRAAIAWLRANQGRTRLPAKILHMIPAPDRGEFQERNAEFDCRRRPTADNCQLDVPRA